MSHCFVTKVSLPTFFSEAFIVHSLFPVIMEVSITYQKIRSFKMYNSGTFSLFTGSTTITAISFPEHFSSLQTETSHSLAVIAHPSFLPASGTNNLFSVSIDQPVLDVSYKQNLTSCGLWSGFSERVFRPIRGVAWIWTRFIFVAEQCSNVWTSHILAIYSLTDIKAISPLGLLRMLL